MKASVNVTQKSACTLGDLKGPVSLGLFDEESCFIIVRDSNGAEVSAHVLDVVRAGTSLIRRLSPMAAYRLGLLAAMWFNAQSEPEWSS